jgi:hypothetical protein
MRSTPLPIWMAAIPTPPAAANTSNHSPAQQEFFEDLCQLKSQGVMRTGLQLRATHKRLVTRRIRYGEPCMSLISHLPEITGSFGTYLRPGRTKAHLVEAVPDVASQRFALHKHPVQPRTHGRQAYTGSLGTQQLRFRQTQHPARTGAGAGLDIFPGTAISVVGCWLQ